MLIGKVIRYDNYVGKIVDTKGNTYIFTKDDLIDQVKFNDVVIFQKEVYKTIEIEELRARFIKLYRNNL